MSVNKNRISLALLHYPVLDKEGQLYTTAITNMDVHDIARSSCTYGLDTYYVVSPLSAQREMANTIANFWVSGSGVKRNKDRSEALELVNVQESLEHVLEHETINFSKPIIMATSAKIFDNKTISYSKGQEIIANSSNILLLFGTGYGLAPQVLDMADYVLEPIYGAKDYNHLSVRSAVAIILDRLLAK